MSISGPNIAAVVIGRNEGERLERCLISLSSQISRTIYVDSSSTDDSVQRAQDAGVEIVELGANLPFTAARARNAGVARISQEGTPPDLVQFIDGDCELTAGWIIAASAFLAVNPRVAVVCGRRRERYPDGSLWNRLIDAEWDTPVGVAQACGGDSLMRYDAFRSVDGFNETLIAGEEPELCLRLRRAGWEIHRINAEMTLHDAAMAHVRQWWTRARRTGHAYAEGATLHKGGAEDYNVDRTRRALLWGAWFPLATIIGLTITPYASILLLVWPAQVLRLHHRGMDWARAVFLTIGKLPEAQGVLAFYLNRMRKRPTKLIEYK